MTSGEGVKTREESGTKQWGIPSKLTLAIVPLAVLTFIIGSLEVWNLISSDPASGFSLVDVTAIFTGVAIVFVSVGSLVVIHKKVRSLVIRIEEVSSAARKVANEDLIELVEALRSPNPEIHAIGPLELNTNAPDEVGNLARAFEELHGSLVAVSARQMEALKGGVSSIIVTLARRNTSLVDRQLALLDQLESREDDPEILGSYYKVDHLATRMRRNGESLLVLAGEEPPRVWAKSMEMSDVVRAAVSEVDDYQRIELLAVEPAQLSGGAVADVAHLLAELLDNAAQFSPPTQPVKVTALFDMDGYQLSITDRGVGMSNSKIAELNKVLENPPALGLALEPTMGLYVVSKLAARHSIKVDLIPGIPGLTVRVNVPRRLLERERSRPSTNSRLGAHQREGVFSPLELDITELAAEAQGNAALSENVFKESRREHELEELPQPVSAHEVDQVIDLTGPSLTDFDPDSTETAAADVEGSRQRRVTDRSSSDRSESDDSTRTQDEDHLPVRSPGLAFSADYASSPKTVAPENATGIKSALSDYDRGRRAAMPEKQDESDDSGDGESSPTGEQL